MYIYIYKEQEFDVYREFLKSYVVTLYQQLTL